MEPRSSTLDRIDDAIKAIEQSRRGVLDEVAFLGAEIDRLRAHVEHWHLVAIARERERDETRAELARVLVETDAVVKALTNPRR